MQNHILPPITIKDIVLVIQSNSGHSVFIYLFTKINDTYWDKRKENINKWW